MKKNVEPAELTNINPVTETGTLDQNKKDIKDLIAPSGIDATSTNHLEIVSYNTKRNVYFWRYKCFCIYKSNK